MSQDVEAALADRLLHRTLFFTDAVFAIVLTLLVLELRPPEAHDAAERARQLAALAPSLAAFAMSFALISIFWISHMSTTRRLVRFDWPTALANLLFLFPVCLIPFVSAWFGHDIVGADAWAPYCWVLIATSAASVAMVLVIGRAGGRLIAGGMVPRERVYRLLRAASPGLAFAIGLMLLASGLTGLSHLCFLLIPLFMAIARVWRPTAPR